MIFHDFIVRMQGAPDAYIRNTQESAENQAAYIAATNRQRLGTSLWLQGNLHRPEVPVGYYTPKMGREHIMRLDQ